VRRAGRRPVADCVVGFKGQGCRAFAVATLVVGAGLPGLRYSGLGARDRRVALIACAVTVFALGVAPPRMLSVAECRTSAAAAGGSGPATGPARDCPQEDCV